MLDKWESKLVNMYIEHSKKRRETDISLNYYGKNRY